MMVRLLIDIADGRSAEAYYRSTAEVLRQYRARGATVHLLVAGGRKAMSIYACLAASLLFGENDHVWTILAGSDGSSGGAYHIPPGKLDAVHIVDLPVLPSRLLPGVLADTDIMEWLANRGRPRERFLKSLSAEENALVDMLHTHTYASNDELSRYLGKSVKTIENQLRSIYKKLSEEFELAISPQRKRQILLDVIEGRV
ncbi:MAG: hypothetical protein IPK19_25030 [Chloroflexi bacterium]|nr:hypothetical protein [Chloroflexota bacterium]